ncbi:MAG TPA: cysteine rich repeat-containing protein, partial [Patescibacteria group bacterium]|nr:cysteine rich repeat-containing protein [Patescibacteria group bacterium]
MNKIKSTVFAIFFVGSFALGTTSARAADTIVDTVTEGCKTELDAWCKDVTPGAGRVLSCLAAREDKLSGRCEYALYQASAQLEAFVGAIKHVATECEAEIEKHCAKVELGEGRLAQCLKANEATASPA